MAERLLMKHLDAPGVMATGEAPACTYEQVLRAVFEGQAYLHRYIIYSEQGSRCIRAQSKTKESRYNCSSTSPSWPLIHYLWEARCKTPHVRGI
jgi:hypothetical protein